MKRTLLILGMASLTAAPQRGFPTTFKNVEKELSELLTEAEHSAHEAVVGTETALDDIPSILKAYEDSFKARYAIEQPGAHSFIEAQVSSSLNESAFLAGRSAHTKKALNSLFPDMTPLPRVGYCGSGGGIRAMYETLGCLNGLDQLGLLDTLIYASGLSGSTWALNPWVASKKSVKDYTTDLIPSLTEPLAVQIKNMSEDDLYDLLILLGRTYYNKRELSAVDIYGGLTCHLFLKNSVVAPYQFNLSDLQPQIIDGSFPHIISTSVLGANETNTEEFGHKPTYEFTPFTSGSFETECFVPTWALARVFNNGQSQKITPKVLFPEANILLSAAEKLVPSSIESLRELYALIKQYEDTPYYGHEVPLGFIMGICGSAFSTDMFNALFELYQLLKPGAISPSFQAPLTLIIEIVQEALEKGIGVLGKKLSKGKLTTQEITAYLKNNQLAAAHLPNMRYNLSTDPFDQLETITLVDGGFDLMKLNRANLGIVPLLNRDLDLIIINDASADNAGGAALRAAEEVAHLIKKPFPRVDYTGIETKIATLIVDNDNLKAPVIVYMPGIANSTYNIAIDPKDSCYETQIFQYPREQAENLIGLIKYNTISSKDLIIKAYQIAAHRKKLLKQE